MTLRKLTRDAAISEGQTSRGGPRPTGALVGLQGRDHHRSLGGGTRRHGGVLERAAGRSSFGRSPRNHDALADE